MSASSPHGFVVVRRGYRPRKIAFLAWHAWRDADHGEHGEDEHQ